MFSDRSIRITGQTLWNSLNTKFKHCKTTKHFRNVFKSSFIIMAEHNSGFTLIIFGTCLHVFLLLLLLLFCFCFVFVCLYFVLFCLLVSNLFFACYIMCNIG